MITIINGAIALVCLANLAASWNGIASGLCSAAIVITFIAATVYERLDMRREREREVRR